MINRIEIFLLYFILVAVCNTAVCFGKEEANITEPEPVLKNLSFDKETGIISYELTVPAWVRIRIGIGDGPLYCTICDWEERAVGKYKEEWDGMDSSGTFKLTGRKDLAFSFNYFTANEEYASNIQLYDMQPPQGNTSGRHLPNLKVNRIHKNHPREFCHEPKIRITFPENTPKTEEGIFIIKNETPVEISLEEKDKIWFRAERYSMHIFIDDVFTQGELDGYTPYQWIFDPKGLSEGKHLVVVNLAGYNDHYAIGSLPVYLKKE